MAIPLLILFTEGLDVRLAVRIEEFLAALLPRRFEFGRRDVPVRPAFLEDRTQVLAEFFQSGPPEEPVAHVDLIEHFPFVLNREGFPKSCQCASLTALIRFWGTDAEAVFDGLA